MLVVGKVPISPSTVVGPVFVMPEPAVTAKLVATPSGTAVAAASALRASVRANNVDAKTAEMATAETDNDLRASGPDARACPFGSRGDSEPAGPPFFFRDSLFFITLHYPVPRIETSIYLYFVKY